MSQTGVCHERCCCRALWHGTQPITRNAVTACMTSSSASDKMTCHGDVTCRPFMRTYGRRVANKLPQECPAARSNRQFGVSYSPPFSCWRRVLGQSSSACSRGSPCSSVQAGVPNHVLRLVGGSGLEAKRRRGLGGLEPIPDAGAEHGDDRCPKAHCARWSECWPTVR